MWSLTAGEEDPADPGRARPSFLEAESFASQEIALNAELDTLRNATISAIADLASENPNPKPTLGWRGFGGEDPGACILNGTWKLVFTDAADATFKKGKRGAATTYQEIDAAGGWFVNCVDFSSETSKLRGFRVFVEGKALSETEIQLIFRKVKLFRRSRFPRLFGEITFGLPNPGLLRAIGRFFARSRGRGKANPSDRGAGFQLLYVDEDLRVHRTFDGLYFVQKRLE